MRNWSGKPDPAQRGCAQKPNIKAKIVCRPRMQSATHKLAMNNEQLTIINEQ
jgi:hypothetical protein